MEYIFLSVLNIIFIIVAFLFFNYIQNNKNNKVSNVRFIVLIIGYILFITVFNYSTVRLFTKDLYNYYYDVKKLKTKINNVEKEIQTITGDINELDNSFSNFEYDTIKKEIETYKEEIANLETEKEELANTLSSKKSEYNSLQTKYTALEAKTNYKIANFPTVSQFPKYPNGCEITALYLLLKYHGITVDLEELADELDKGPAPFTENGIAYGSDPENVFVGDPRKTNRQGYGVFQKPIAKLANKYKKGIIDYTGHSLKDVLKIVGSGKPVQVWASINLRETSICQSWTDVVSGKKINWRCNLHSMVLIGYTYDEVIVSDPYVGKIRSFSKSQFEKIYNRYGKRALYYE